MVTRVRALQWCRRSKADRSSRVAIVTLEPTTQELATLDIASLGRITGRGIGDFRERHIPEALVRPVRIVEVSVALNQMAHVLDAEDDEVVEAFFLGRLDPSFRVSIEIR